MCGLRVIQVLHYLAALRGAAPFVPGVMLNWELMVGNSNTRWHWATPDGTAEPGLPWDASRKAADGIRFDPP